MVLIGVRDGDLVGGGGIGADGLVGAGLASEKELLEEGASIGSFGGVVGANGGEEAGADANTNGEVAV